MKTTIYGIDRLINKPVSIQGEFKQTPQAKELCIYKDEDGKEMVAQVLGYKTKTEKSGTYVTLLEGGEKILFDKNQDKAKKLFETFKTDFKKEFPDSKPITARMNLSGNQVYFYFFAETRYNFSTFVKAFRKKIGINFFIYQVGARDRVRLHPHLNERYDPSGLPLMYHIFKHSLPGVNGETISLQHLGGRNNDRLKDWSGKLDHTLNFEKDFYEEESKKYPRHGQIISVEGKKMKCTGFNILTGEINVRGKADEDKSDEGRRHGEFKKITLKEYVKSNIKKTSTPKSKTT